MVVSRPIPAFRCVDQEAVSVLRASQISLKRPVADCNVQVFPNVIEASNDGNAGNNGNPGANV